MKLFHVRVISKRKKQIYYRPNNLPTKLKPVSDLSEKCSEPH